MNVRFGIPSVVDGVGGVVRKVRSFRKGWLGTSCREGRDHQGGKEGSVV